MHRVLARDVVPCTAGFFRLTARARRGGPRHCFLRFSRAGGCRVVSWSSECSQANLLCAASGVRAVVVSMQRDRASRERVDRALDSRYNYLPGELCCYMRRGLGLTANCSTRRSHGFLSKTPRYGVRGDGSRGVWPLGLLLPRSRVGNERGASSRLLDAAAQRTRLRRRLRAREPSRESARVI